MKHPFALWNRKAIKQVIWNLWSMRLALRTISDYMKRWVLPLKSSLKWTMSGIQKRFKNGWMKTIHLSKKRAKLHGGKAYWGDEASFCNDCQHSRGYAPKGKTPEVTVTAKSFSSNMILAVNNRGTIRFMIYDENCSVFLAG